MGKVRNSKDISVIETEQGDYIISNIRVKTLKGAEESRKPKGKYVTIYSDEWEDWHSVKILASQLRKFNIGQKVLIVGLGNKDSVSDSLGSRVCDKVLATAPRMSELTELTDYKCRITSVFAPNVLGNTGISSLALVKNAVEITKPDTLITIDSLVAGSLERLATNIQMCDTGISPGAGVGNNNGYINRETMGVKTVSIGVPLAISAIAMKVDTEGIEHGSSLIFCDKSIDLQVRFFSDIIARAINLVCIGVQGGEAYFFGEWN